MRSLSYHFAPRPKTLTSVGVIIQPRVAVAMRIVLVEWVWNISVFSPHSRTSYLYSQGGV